MHSDETFHQRWEFRRKEVDGDSSSDDTSGHSSVKRRNIVTDLVLLEDDEGSDDDNRQKTLQPNEKKLKPSKKKQVKKENRRKINPEAEEIVMLKGLKDFSESLIQELAVSRENMFAHMRDEMRELVARGMSRKKPNAKRKGVVKPCKNYPRVLEMATKNETRVPKTARMNFDQQVVSSPYLTLPTVISNPHFQNPSNHYLHPKVASFSHKSVGLFGQSCPQTASVPFPIPHSQGTDNGSNISSLTYRESPFVARSDQRFQHINMARKSDGEFESMRPQEVKDGLFYSTSLRNHR